MPDRLPTGFPSLDQRLGGGLPLGGLVVLTGDTGVGTSLLALAIALRTAGRGEPVALVSTEMDVATLVERGVRIGGAALPGMLHFLSLDDWLADAAATPPALLVVDALDGLAPGDDGAAAHVTTLKRFAVTHRTVVLLVAHLAAPVRGRADERPALTDLGAAGALRHQSDLVLGLYREELYHHDPGIAGAAELLVLKDRHGPGGMTDLFFRRAALRFEDLADPE